MQVNVFEDDGVVVLSLDGSIGFDQRGRSLAADIDATLRSSLQEGKNRFVLDLAAARAKVPSAVNILFEPFLKVLRTTGVRVVVVPSREEPRGRSSLFPTARASRLSKEDLRQMTLDLVFPVFEDIEQAIEALQAQ